MCFVSLCFSRNSKSVTCLCSRKAPRRLTSPLLSSASQSAGRDTTAAAVDYCQHSKSTSPVFTSTEPESAGSLVP